MKYILRLGTACLLSATAGATYAGHISLHQAVALLAGGLTLAFLVLTWEMGNPHA